MRLAFHGKPLVGRDYAISAEYRSELLRKSLKMECPGMAENPFFFAKWENSIYRFNSAVQRLSIFCLKLLLFE